MVVDRLRKRNGLVSWPRPLQTWGNCRSRGLRRAGDKARSSAAVEGGAAHVVTDAVYSATHVHDGPRHAPLYVGQLPWACQLVPQLSFNTPRKLQSASQFAVQLPAVLFPQTPPAQRVSSVAQPLGSSVPVARAGELLSHVVVSGSEYRHRQVALASLQVRRVQVSLEQTQLSEAHWRLSEHGRVKLSLQT
jgi:hypothetical protein